MRESNKKELVWVYPKFKTMLKIEAAEKGSSILQYTKHLSELGNPLHSLQDDKKKRKMFDFP